MLVALGQSGEQGRDDRDGFGDRPRDRVMSKLLAGDN
jgi:hypothetical protein